MGEILKYGHRASGGTVEIQSKAKWWKSRNTVKGLVAVKSKYILRDFRNAPFYILCLFHMMDLRMFSLSFFILLQNGP